MTESVHDAVIVGAGPSGLAAAARLAHFGVRVCLLEAHRRPGGLSSWHHVGGREISSGLHAFTNYSPDGRGGALGRLLRQLRLKYADLDLRPQRRSSIRFPSATLSFTNDPEFFRQEVAAAFPRAIDGFDRFRRLILETDEGEITRRQTSTRQALEEHIREPLLADMLLCPVMFYGNPGGVGDDLDGGRTRPDMDWLLFCVVWKCIFESGFGHPAGGMRPLWETLAARIRAAGGEIRTGARVKAFVSDGDSVRAAVLADGGEVRGKVFFSSAGAAETELLLAAGDAASLDAGRTPAGSISIAEGICLLDGPPADAGLDDAVVFFSFTDEFSFRRPDATVEHSGGVLCAPGNYLPPEPAGNLIKISQLASYPAWKALSPASYRSAKRDAAAGMAAALARLGVSPPAKPAAARGDYGIFDDLFTPLTLERFTSHSEGALYGSPVKRRDGVTSRANLFLIGADQGFHGIVGAMLSGVTMANRHCLTRPGRGTWAAG